MFKRRVYLQFCPKMWVMRRGYGALQRRLLAILNAEDRIFETYTLVAGAFDVKADEDGMRLISTAQMSAARRRCAGSCAMAP